METNNFKISWKTFLIAPFCSAWSGATKAQKRRNILWIISDDLGQELECYENTDVRTPNMDKKVFRFPLHQCLCSHAGLLPQPVIVDYGNVPASINCQDHWTIDMTELPKGILPITEYFRQVGYFCTNGKAKNMSKGGKTDFNFITHNRFDGTDWVQRAPGRPFFRMFRFLSRSACTRGNINSFLISRIYVKQ